MEGNYAAPASGRSNNSVANRLAEDRLELREGLEALLIVVSMLAFLRKAGQPEMARWVHYGWVLALIVGTATWVLATWMITISGASRELSELELWRKYGSGRELGAGVVDVKGFQEETAESVGRRIRRVLQVCPVEKLTLNPDCGFGWSPRYMCNQKLRGLAAGAALVRKELTGKS